jgi:hypothetical protein
MPSVINEQLVARWSDPKYQVLSSLVLEQLVRPLTNEELRLLDPLKISTQLDGQKWLLDLRGLRYTGKTFKKASWKNSSVFEWAVLDGSCFVACSFEELHIQWSKQIFETQFLKKQYVARMTSRVQSLLAQELRQTALNLILQFSSEVNLTEMRITLLIESGAK